MAHNGIHCNHQNQGNDYSMNGRYMFQLILPWDGHENTRRKSVRNDENIQKQKNVHL